MSNGKPGEALKCARCGKPATERLTCDMDIRGVPVCGGCSNVHVAINYKLRGNDSAYERLMKCEEKR